MENEDNSCKCVPLFPRKGKRILFILIMINVIIIWFVYKKSSISHFNSNSSPVTTKSVHSPLYNVSVFHIPLLYTKDMVPYYVEINSNTWCLFQGTDIKESKRYKKCICSPRWFGLDCGIPSSVWRSEFMQEGKNAGVEIRRREKPRRIILSLVFGQSFDLLDINIHNTFSIVDVFLIAEDKNSIVSNMFKKGYLPQFHSKVMPVYITKKIPHTEENQWVSLMLSELWITGWKRLSDFRPDDIFLFSHASSIVSADVLLFLKLYDGYPEPFSFYLRPLLFKFSKILKSNNTTYALVPFEPSGCTFQFIATLCEYSIQNFLQNKCMSVKTHNVFFEKKYWILKKWTIGKENSPSGWHCNLCSNSEYSVENVRLQKWFPNNSASLLSNKKYVNMSVIEHFFNLGNYSDLTLKHVSNTDLYFAPKILLKYKKYSYLLD